MATLEGVDRRLLDIVDRVRRDWARRGYRVDYTPAGGKDRGQRSATSQHVHGRALDIEIYDPSGKWLDNYQNGETFRTYEMFAQDARRIQQRDYPELDKAFRWGGYYSGKSNYGAVDLMHLDLGGLDGLGMAGGSWAKGLNNTQRGYYPDAVSIGIGQMEEAAKGSGFGVPRAAGTVDLENLSRREVKNLQVHLNAGGFVGADGQPLTVDGRAGKNTRAAVQAALTQAGSISTNSGRNQVRAVQAALNAAGVTDAQGDPLKVDGIYGAKTTAAISKAAGFGTVAPQQSRPSTLDQLARSAVPAPAPSASMMSMAPAVRPSLRASVPPQTSGSVAAAPGTGRAAAAAFAPTPRVGSLDMAGVPLSPSGSTMGKSAFRPTPGVGPLTVSGAGVAAAEKDPRAAGIYAPTAAANPRIAGAYDSLKGPSSLHLASDLARKAQGLPATPSQSPFAGSPERPSVRAAQDIGFPASRGMGTAPLPSSLSPGPVQPRGPLQIGALVQDMRAAPKPASFRAPMDLNPGMAALADTRIKQGFSAIPDTDLDLFSGLAGKARGRTVPVVTSGAAVSPAPQLAASSMMAPRPKASVQTSGSAVLPAAAPSGRAVFAPQVRPSLQMSGMAAPTSANPMASGTFAPQVRPSVQMSGTAVPVQANPMASGSVSPRPVQTYNPLSSIRAPARPALPTVQPPAQPAYNPLSSIQAPRPAARPSSRPPISSSVTAPMSIPRGALLPYGPSVTVGTLPTVDVPAAAPVQRPPAAISFVPMPPQPPPAPPPQPLAQLAKPVGKVFGGLGNVLGGMFGRPGPIDAAMAAAMAGGSFAPKEFWDKFNSFAGIGSGGGAIGLQGMASYAAAKASGMGGKGGGDSYHDKKARDKADRASRSGGSSKSRSKSGLF